MSDRSLNDPCAGEISGLNKKIKRIAENSLRNNTLNCPSVLTGMSHEMRTHMNAIVAFSFLMNEDSCNKSQHEEFSKQILSSCEQLIGLFDSFIDSGIIDTGITKTNTEICRLDNILDELLSEFRVEIRKEGHRELELLTEIQSPDFREVYIDKIRVLRVIRSLFQNAIKNTKSGYIKIGYYFREEKVSFFVLDSGQGYLKCKEFLYTENLNESLALYNDTTIAINITLAKKLIQMLGGTFHIECIGNKGAGIYFSIPAKMVSNTLHA